MAYFTVWILISQQYFGTLSEINFAIAKRVQQKSTLQAKKSPWRARRNDIPIVFMNSYAREYKLLHKVGEI